jgi:hypothetical protein
LQSNNMRGFISIIFISLFLTGLSGCSRPYTKDMQTELDTKPVETKIEALPAIRFDGDELEFKISAGNPTFEFDFGKSYVALVKLPSYRPEQGLKINSLCECVGFRKSVFIPIVAVLDKNFKSRKNINFRTQSPTGFTAASYEGLAILEPEDSYLLVYSNPEKYGKYADHVTAPFTSTSSTYERSGGTLYKTTTYHSGQMGLWWRGSAVGAFELSLIDSVGLDRMLK